RDINASINIRNEALRILSLGTSDTANGGSVRRLGGKISCLLDATPNEVRSPNYNL
ncbi:MAG: transposase, partial [Crocosphaera sp.]|nr:transposase [Crocosphaera sp.]